MVLYIRVRSTERKKKNVYVVLFVFIVAGKQSEKGHATSMNDNHEKKLLQSSTQTCLFVLTP